MKSKVSGAFISTGALIFQEKEENERDPWTLWIWKDLRIRVSVQESLC